MKTQPSLPRALFAAALALTLSASAVFAQGGNPVIIADETGFGTIQFPGGMPIPMPGVLAPDPGPGGLSLALTYNLLGPPSLVAGDLHVFDPGSENLSDIIRFNPAGTGGNPGYPASMLFYSIAGNGLLGDTGFPTGSYTNIVNVFETGAGGILYTPTANQPGFVAGFSVTYQLTSGRINVPDTESTAALLGLGVGAVGLLRRKLVA